jgi:hypothetical protein
VTYRIAFVGVSVQVGDAEGPLEDVLLSHRRSQPTQHQLIIKLLQICSHRIVVVFEPLLKVLLSREDVVHIFQLAITQNRLLQPHSFLRFGLVV